MFHLPARRITWAPPPRMGHHDRQAEPPEAQPFPERGVSDPGVVQQTEAPNSADRGQGAVPTIGRARAPPDAGSQISGPKQEQRQEPEEEQANSRIDRRQSEASGDAGRQG